MYLSVPIEFVTVLFCITFHTKKHNRKKNVEYLYLYSIILRFCLSQILLLKKKECLNVGTVPMFKMRNVGTQIMYNLCFELEFGLYGKYIYINNNCIRFLLESSRTHYLGLASPIQSGINCKDKEFPVQKVSFEKLVFSTCISTGVWASSFF